MPRNGRSARAGADGAGFSGNGNGSRSRLTAAADRVTVGLWEKRIFTDKKAPLPAYDKTGKQDADMRGAMSG
jgi:hypothetical protein